MHAILNQTNLTYVIVGLVSVISLYMLIKPSRNSTLESFSPTVIANMDKQYREKDMIHPVLTRDSETGRINQPEMLEGIQREMAPLLFIKSSPFCCPSLHTDSRGCKCNDEPKMAVDFTSMADNGSGNGFRN